MFPLVLSRDGDDVDPIYIWCLRLQSVCWGWCSGCTSLTVYLILHKHTRIHRHACKSYSNIMKDRLWLLNIRDRQVHQHITMETLHLTGLDAARVCVNVGKKKKCWFKLQESHWGYFNHCVIMFLWECFCSCNLYKFCVMLFSMLGNKSKANNPLSPLFVQVIRGIPLGVGQIFACGDLGPSLLILGAVFLYSPLLAVHALLGSAVGTLTGWFQSVCSCGCVGGVGERKVLLHLFVHHTNAPLTINPNLTQSSVILGSTCQHFIAWYITLELTTYRELLNFTVKCEEVSITVWK